MMNATSELILVVYEKPFLTSPENVLAMNLEERVLKRIVPSKSEEERLREVVSILKKMLQSEIENLGIEAYPMLVGSVAKSTHLKEPEIDMFVCFSPSTSRGDLERYGLRLGEYVLEKAEQHFAEHPYLAGEFEGFETEIVPCYEVKDPTKKMSAVDRTPFHTAYVKENLKESQNNEVRLLKRFAKGIGVYGAEAKVMGLSGYLCELLVLKYGTFQKVLKASSKWKKGTLIELDKKAGKRFREPLVFIDPVDAGRNVASALSHHQMGRFIHLSKAYLKNPKISFFFPPKRKRPTRQAVEKRMKARGTDFVAVVMRKPDIVDDILYPQVWKAEKSIRNLCEKFDFSVHDSGATVVGKEILILVELVSAELPAVRKHMGPAPQLRNASDFVEKWKASRKRIAGPYVENGRLFFDLRREFRSAKGLLRKKLMDLGLGKNLDEVVSKKFIVLLNEEILSKGYLVPLSEFLEKSV
jgi:tRNA nucleotidyltransferase (CCA-adding enzyme)